MTTVSVQLIFWLLLKINLLNFGNFRVLDLGAIQDGFLIFFMFHGSGLLEFHYGSVLSNHE